jgi:hypothetical protein
MRRKYNIKNLEELQAALSGLKAEYTMQGERITSDTKVYVKQYSIKSLTKKYFTPSNLFKADEQLNISSKVMSFLLPVLMNNTLFRGSGFITKTLVGLATSKVGKSLDAGHLTGMVSSVKSWFGGAKKKIVRTKPVGYIDYGIPPDSETF